MCEQEFNQWVILFFLLVLLLLCFLQLLLVKSSLVHLPLVPHHLKERDPGIVDGHKTPHDALSLDVHRVPKEQYSSLSSSSSSSSSPSFGFFFSFCHSLDYFTCQHVLLTLHFFICYVHLSVHKYIGDINCHLRIRHNE